MYAIGNYSSGIEDNPYLSNTNSKIQKTRGSGKRLTDELSQLIQEKKEEILDKLQAGDTEPSYRIGAGSYTEKEWKELLSRFDKMEDALRKEAGQKVTEETAYKKHPDERGKKRHLYNGVLYTFEEIWKIWQKEVAEKFTSLEHR